MRNSSNPQLIWIAIISIVVLIVIASINSLYQNEFLPPTEEPVATEAPATTAPQATEPPATEPPETEPPVSSELPSFPWPVPQPSAMQVLTLGPLGQPAATGVTFRDVDGKISNALASAGYDERSYFKVPGGFAIATRLEKTDKDGYPDSSDRWASELAPIDLTDFSLSDYLEALFGAPKGHYRIFVFVVSSEIVVQSGTPVAQAEAQTWIVEGANKLPNNMNDLPYTSDHTTTAYIYEFIQSGVGGAVNFSIPSDITGRQHLERAGLWENLN